MKRQLQISLGMIYLVVLIGSFILFLKPDASAFFKKYQINLHNLSRDGEAYAYKLLINVNRYNPDTLIIYEDQDRLAGAWSPYVRIGGSGTFAISSVDIDQITVMFNPSSPGNPATNGHAYYIYIRPTIISKDLWRLIFLLLLYGFIIFVCSNLANPRKREILVKSPAGMVELWINLLNHTDIDNWPSKNKVVAPYLLVTRAAINTVLIGFFYVFMEWLFIVTKPSFLNSIGWLGKVKVFFINGLAVSLILLLGLSMIFILDIFITPIIPSFRKYALHFPSSLMAACLCLLLIDNFTYTIFNFGIIDSNTPVSLIYGFGFFTGTILFTLKLSTTANKISSKRSIKIKSFIAGGLAITALVTTGFSFDWKNPADGQISRTLGIENFPNIIILSTDGLDAANMSAYGYKRDTTPFIRELTKTSLVSQNNFTNASYSPGSETAILTSKLAITTHFLYPPDILQGKNAYEHLPGILKNIGYRTISLGVKYYVDVSAFNFQNAFDIVNCKDNPYTIPSDALYSFEKEIYFFNSISERIFNRVNRIFLIVDIQNPHKLVSQPEYYLLQDQHRIACFRDELDNTIRNGKPLFAHMHLMGTHGDYYYPSTRVFSEGKTQDKRLMVDFYDDTILVFDNQVQQIVQYLTDVGQFENTIFILYTDHSKNYDTRDRIPLIIHFPNGDHKGIISSNTQNIDIAPTILDYLNIEQPSWMEGNSLLQNIDPYRLIISAESQKVDFGSQTITYPPTDVQLPPFYQFSKLTIIQCQTWYLFNLRNNTTSNGVLPNYQCPCSTGLLDTPEEIQEKLAELLMQRNFKLPENWKINFSISTD